MHKYATLKRFKEQVIQCRTTKMLRRCPQVKTCIGIDHNVELAKNRVVGKEVTLKFSKPQNFFVKYISIFLSQEL